MTDQTEHNEELKTVHEIATYYRVDDTTVRRWVKRGALEAVILPHTTNRMGYRIKVSEIKKFDPEYQG